MKTLTLKSALLVLCFVLTQSASAIVGYYNLPLYPGDNLIANQLDNSGGNTLDDILNTNLAAAIPDGATFTEWDPVGNAFLPVSTYSLATASWSTNYNFDTFASGQGGLLHTPSPWTNTFVGQLIVYTNIFTPSVSSPPLWNPNYANGLYLLGCPMPLSGPIDTMFSNVVARAPQDGEWVKILDPTTQTYTTSTFHTGTGWDNGDPTLGVGQAAWFDLGPVAVPEPSSLALLSCSAALMVLLRRRSPQ
jgi:hypothetical protein